MELEMFDDDRVSTLLAAGDNCLLNISNLIKVFEPLTEYTIITTFEVVIFAKDPTKGSEFFRYQNLIDALQKFNEIEEEMT